MSRFHERWLLFVPLALVVGPFLLWPMLNGFVLTFTNAGPFQPSPRFIGLNNYLSALEDDAFRAALVHMIVIAAVTVSAEVIVGIAVAFALREPFRGRTLLRALLLLPWLLSPVGSGVLWHNVLYPPTGFLNYLTGLLRLPSPPYLLDLDTSFATVVVAEVWRKTPLVIFLALPGLLAIPREAWDQATLDGLSLLSQVRHVALPRLRGLLLALALLLAGDALGLSESIYFLTGGGPGTRTMTPGVYSYVQAIVAQNWSAGGTRGWFIVSAVLLVGAGYIGLARRWQEAS